MQAACAADPVGFLRAHSGERPAGLRAALEARPLESRVAALRSGTTARSHFP